jgi:hypothetical protein
LLDEDLEAEMRAWKARQEGEAAIARESTILQLV